MTREEAMAILLPVLEGYIKIDSDSITEDMNLFSDLDLDDLDLVDIGIDLEGYVDTDLCLDAEAENWNNVSDIIDLIVRESET